MQQEKPFNPAEAVREWVNAMTAIEKETMENEITTIAQRINDTLKPHTQQ